MPSNLPRVAADGHRALTSARWACTADGSWARLARAGRAEGGYRACMTSAPDISVVVPSLNRAEYLRQTLESILSQQGVTLECIVVDGGSTDGTHELLKEFGPRIVSVVEQDGGPFDAINTGWAMAHGSVLAWLNADDLWRPGAARVACDFLEARPEVDVVYGHCGGIDASGRRVWWGEAREWDTFRSLVGVEHIIHQPAAFLRSETVRRVGPLRRFWTHDHDLWLRIALSGGVLAPVDCCLADERIHAGNVTSDPWRLLGARLEMLRVQFADPALPPGWRRHEQRAISTAYVRSLDVLKPGRAEDWRTAARLTSSALRVCPTNLPFLLGHSGRLLLELAAKALRRGVPGPRG
jgi:Glycosyl transferase family 2